ncbi:membrane protein [Limoniibacter endophyticus]|uniref:Membrane protein n=2 Tax=Limoniibacter endophyticus TaxID=1565040 RepID=A0A8J3DPI7_9HYPH|nr:membrane protein [Limoniibacter endophyticus]
MTAIGLKVLAVICFVSMSSLIKAAGEVALGQVVFFRSIFAFVLIVAYLQMTGQMAGAFRTARPFGHVIRGLAGVASMFCAFYALILLPLPEAVTLGYAQPLLIVVFSAVFLRENIRIYRWSAVVIGLIGVVIISWPKLTLFTSGEAIEMKQSLGVIVALIGAALTAVALLMVRDLVRSESSASIVIWFSITTTVFGLLTIPFGWTSLTTFQAIALIGCGILGGVAQLLMTEAYRYAEASTVAPFEYTSMIFAIVIGYFAFGDIPTMHTLVGGFVVIAAGLFIIFREHQLRKRAAQQSTAG